MAQKHRNKLPRHSTHMRHTKNTSYTRIKNSSFTMVVETDQQMMNPYGYPRHNWDTYTERQIPGRSNCESRLTNPVNGKNKQHCHLHKGGCCNPTVAGDNAITGLSFGTFRRT